MPEISLLVPSRGRPKNIEQLRENILNTTSDIYDIELLLKLDSDNLYELDSRYDYFIKSHVDKRSSYLNRDYYNFLAKEGRGRYLWGLGDDCRIETKNWNILLYQKIEEYLKDKPDRIAYISVNEVDSQAKHPCFPLITKEAFQVLGEYHCSELLSWGSDRILWEIYSGIGRTLHIPEISIKHLSYHDGSAPFDETARSMKERFFRNPNCHNQVLETKVPHQIEKLKKYIEEFK
jgi:hypothetical protein